MSRSVPAIDVSGPALQAMALADREARRRALDPATSFIVEAPAGSGKTELLIQRFLSLLARVEKPESVLAVTFTRKAAAEMRARVLRALAAADGPEPTSDHERTTARLAAAVRSEDRNRGWSLTANPSRLSIQTIDSLAASIVGRMPWVSGMGPLPRPDDDVGDLYQQAAARTIEAVYTRADATSDAVGRLLEHLDNNFAAVTGLLASMLASRDQWLRHVSTGALASDQFRQELNHTLSGIVSDRLQYLESQFPRALRADTAELARRAGTRAAGGNRANRVACLAGIEDLPSSDAVEQWRALAHLFLRQDGQRRTRLTVREGFGPGTAADKERFLSLDPGVEFLERLHAVRRLPPPALSAAQWEVLSALRVVLPEAVSELRAAFGAESRVDFTEIGFAAREALGTSLAPTALAFTMDCRIEHILVDEFQDTSESQYELLSRLTDGWDASDGRTLFLVGDPMQSIYRFRKADVALFLRARREGFGSIPLESLTLRVNFRSTRPVVEWINRVVGPAFPARENLVGGAVTYTPSTAARTTSDGDSRERAVHLHPVRPRDDDAEAEVVVEIIRREKERSPEGTVAILVRSRAHAERISARFRSDGLGFQAIEMDPLARQPVVRDLWMLTRALSHEADRIAWLSVLRAPWCGLTLDDMLRLTEESEGAAVSRLWSDPVRCAGLSQDGARRLSRVVGILNAGLSRRGTLGLRRWVEGVWLELGGPAGAGDPNAVHDANAFLDLLDRMDAGGEIRDWPRFDRAASQLFAGSDSRVETNARGEALIQLLTIHKAKGLEFDTVILPGLGRPTPPDRAGLVEWLEFLDSGGRSRLIAAPVPETGTARDPLSAFISGVQSERARNEETRLLYVAATRARNALHLVAHVDVDPRTASTLRPDRRSALSRLWERIGEEFESRDPRRSRIDVPDDAAARRVPMVRFPADWVPPRPERPPVDWPGSPVEPDVPEVHRPSFDWASDLQRRIGIVIHRLLQTLGREASLGTTDADVERLPIGALLASEGLSGERLDRATARVKDAIERTIGDPRGLWILRRRLDDDSELPLAGTLGGVVRRVVLDRTFVEDGVRWIIDFKSGVHEGSGRERFLASEVDRYRSQMDLYARIVRGFDSRPIRMGLYYPSFSGWREWAFEATERDGQLPETVSEAVDTL